MARKDSKVQWPNKVLTSFQGMVADIIEEPDLQVVLQNAAKRVAKLVEADIVTVHIYDSSTGRVRAAAGIGLMDDKAFRQHVAGRGKAALLVVDRGKPVLAEDVSTSGLAGPFAARERVKSAAGFPLKRGDEVMGVLFVSYRETHRFKPGERETIISLGNLVSIAINVASLYDKERVRASTIQQINDIGRSLIAVRGVEVLEKIVEGARSVLGADVVVLYEYLEAIADVNVPPIMAGDLKYPQVLGEISSRRPHRESAVFKALEREKPFYAGRADQDWGDFVKGWAHEGSFLDREDIVSSAAVPLVVDEKPVGVLFVNYRTYHAFPEEERNTIEFFAAQAAIAIQNARFFERERTLRVEAAALRDVSRAISSDIELRAVGKAILEELRKEIGYTKASVQLIHGEERKLIAYEGYPAAAVDEWLLRPVSEDRLVNRVVQLKKPYILSDPAEDSDWVPRPGTQDIKSWVGLPLVYGEEVIALLTLDHTEPGFYRKDQEEMFALFAERAVIDVRNASLFDIARRRIRDLEIVNDVVKAINTKLDTRDILRTIVSQIAGRLECAYCALFLKQEQEEQLSSLPAMICDAQMEELAELPSGLARELARRVFQHRQSMLVHDSKEDPQLSDAAREDDEHRSMVGAPVIVDGQVLGVIVADQKEYSWFSETDRQLVDTLAQQARSAIERARGLDLLHNIGNQIIRRPQIDPQEMLQQIVSGAIRLTRAETGVIFLIGKDRKSIVGSYKYPPDFDYPPPRMEGKGGITRQIIDTGEIVSFSDIRQTDDVNPLMHGRVQSMIGVPLKLDNQVVGVLYLNYHGYHEFTATEKSMLSTVASQAAIAYRNAQLFRESRRQADELLLLQQVSSRLMTLNLDELLSFIIQGAMRLTQTESGFIYLVDEKGKRITKSVAYPPDGPYPKSRLRKKGLTRHVVKTREPVFVSDTSKDERVHPAIVKQGIRCFVAQPLKEGKRVLGVLYLNDQSLRTFSQEECALIQALADQAAIAICNASLYEESKRLSEGHRTLNAVGTKLMGMLDEKKILQYVARSAANTLFGDQADASGYTHCTVFRKQEDKLVVQTSQGNRDWSLLEGRDFDLGQGIAGWVAKTGRRELVRDSFRKKHFQKGWSAPQPDPRSLIVVPIPLDGGIYGVISAEHDKVGAFDLYDLQLLETLASQAGQALQNAHLFATRHRLETQLESLHQVVQEQNLEIVLGRIVEGIRAILGEGISPTINLYNEQTQEFTHCHACGPLKDALQTSPRPGGTGRYVIGTGESLYLPDVHNPPPGIPAVRQDWIAMGVKSFAALPLKREEHIDGVLYINAQKTVSFSPEIRRVLELFAGQAATAIENARDYEHISQNLERRIQELGVLTEIGRAVSDLGIDEILDLVYEKMGKIIDLQDAQVQFAFYDESKDEVSFPLAVEQDDGRTIDVVRSGKREEDYRLPDEGETVEQFKPRARRDPPGLNEYVIRNKEPLLIVEDFEQTAEEKGIRVWPTFGRLDRPTDSWLGVPMIVGGRVTGVISIQSLEREHAFDQDHIQVLMALANQAAAAIENARLYDELQNQNQALKDLQERLVDAEKEVVMLRFATDFIHQVNNLVGTIPIWLQQARNRIEETRYHDEQLEDYLSHIQADVERVRGVTVNLIRSAQRKPVREQVDVVEIVQAVGREIRTLTSDEIHVVVECESQPILVEAVRIEFETTLREIAWNGIKAIQPIGTGTLALRVARAPVRAADGRSRVLIEIRDDGKGISPGQPVFESMFSTTGGQGYGLWRAQKVIDELGGSIEYKSVPGDTTFTIELPEAPTGETSS